MKNRVIKYLEKYYCIIINTICLLFLEFALFACIEKRLYIGIVTLPILISFFIIILITTFKYSIVFNYNDKIIKVLEPGNFRIIQIKMNEIKMIKFYDVKSEIKNNVILNEGRFLYNFSPLYVYNEGKKYIFEIIKKNGQKIKISYNSLYNCKSEKTVNAFEIKANEIVKEFNNFMHTK